MSASLVGSEMCIRDSCSPFPLRKWHMLARNMAHLWRMILDAMSSGEGSVSYTHLTLPTICSV
eukprot:8378936-Alexandrium_andersonii.AAC.1